MLNVSTYKNFDELENSLTLDEVTLLVTGIQDQRYEGYKFQASLKGIDLDEQQEGEAVTFEDIQNRVALRARAAKEGKTEEQIEFAEFGIGVETV